MMAGYGHKHACRCYSAHTDTVLFTKSDIEFSFFKVFYKTNDFGLPNINQWPLLLTWFTINPSMDK